MGPRPDRSGAAALKADLVAELAWLPPIVDFVSDARERFAVSKEPRFDVLPLAHGLTDLYTLAEKVFERIAQAFEGPPRPGPKWHAELLKRMALDIPGERPPLLRPETLRELVELRKFRHLLRNVYGIRIDPARCAALAERFGPAAAAFREDVEAFLRFLDVLAAA